MQTTHVKSRSVNVTTGEVAEIYYEQAEWDALQAANAAAALPNARSKRRAEIAADAQVEVDAIIKPPMLTQYQVRMLELLEIKIGRAWDVAEQAEVDAMKATNAAARTVRAREVAALAAIDAALTVAAVEAVVL